MKNFSALVRSVFALFLVALLIAPAPPSYAVTPYVPIAAGHPASVYQPGDVHRVRAKVTAKGGKSVSIPKAFATKSLKIAGGTGNRIAAAVGKAVRGPADVVHQVVKNAMDGRLREKLVAEQLRKQYPNAVVMNQVYIRGSDGKRFKDPDTGKARRLDHVVIENGKVLKIVETTSPTASKVAQSFREENIRNSGGTYVKDRSTGKLVNFSKVETETARVNLNGGEIKYAK
ncbi:hypothetical protein ACSV5G_10730 [Agrobacterium cavarae]|uniref:hypothetical protein n=1 Tax=Agrobacterium cavarae TaxID=2528239 RepID=UPI003FD6B46F